MPFALWMVLVAALLPYGLVLYAKATPAFFEKDFNKNPRDYAGTLSGARQRAYWAHQNGFEAFPPFAAGVIIAVMSGATESHVNLAAGVFIGCRVVHAILYILDLDKLRTLVWTAGFGAVVSLFVLAAS